MGSRERKRQELRKRKRRGSQRPRTPAEDGVTEKGGETEGESFQERLSRRGEERNAEARASLEPLKHGDRPTAVTVGAVISAISAVIFTTSAIVAIFSEAEVQGSEPSPVPLAVFAVPMWMMTWGMWKARYWAVLGFQMLLLLVLVAAALGLVAAETMLQLAATLILLLGSGALFYFMIRAMARIQMPDRPGQR